MSAFRDRIKLFGDKNANAAVKQTTNTAKDNKLTARVINTNETAAPPPTTTTTKVKGNCVGKKRKAKLESKTAIKIEEGLLAAQ